MSFLTGALSKRWSLVLAAVAGLTYPLAFAPYQLWWLMPVSMAALLFSFVDRTPREAALNGFAFGFTAYLTGIYWITISVHTFGGAPFWLAAFLMLSLVLFLSGYYALLGYLITRFAPAAGALRWWFIVPGFWMLLEWVRGWFLSGFGWLTPGYAHVDSLLLGFLPIGGVLLVGWVVVVTAGTLVAMVRKPSRFALVQLVAAVSLWGVGLVLAHVKWTEEDGTNLTASMVQGSVPQDLKWLPEQLEPTINLYIELTLDHLDSDLIIWPEAAIPRSKHNLTPLWNELERIAARSDTEFLIGTVEYEPDIDARFNSLSAFGSSNAVYRKRHLVPFGEYFPVPEFVKDRMRLMNLPYQNFSPGDDGQPALMLAGQTIAGSICYEDVFSDIMLDMARGSSLLVNVSNDAWFGGSLAPHQHLQIARTRASEVGRYMLRSTNNGISAVINPYGRVVDRSPQFEPYVLTATVPGMRGQTPYMWWGDWPMVVLAFLAVTGGLRRRA